MAGPSPPPQIVKFEWSPVRTGQGKPYMRDPTVQKFLEETTLGLPMPCPAKGRASTWQVPAVSRQKRPAESLVGGSHGPATPPMPADATPRAAPRRSLSSASGRVARAEPLGGARSPSSSPPVAVESAISKHHCRVRTVWPLNDKKLSCAGSGTGTFGKYFAVPPLPELPLHKFQLCAIRWNRRKDTLENSILWIFQDLPVIRWNQTAREMMRRIEILVEHCRGSIFPSTKGQRRLAEDWE